MGIIYYKKGLIFQCPDCGEDIGELISDVYLGSCVRAADILGFGHEIIDGMKMNCIYCYAPYFRDGKFLQIKEKNIVI